MQKVLRFEDDSPSCPKSAMETACNWEGTQHQHPIDGLFHGKRTGGPHREHFDKVLYSALGVVMTQRPGQAPENQDAIALRSQVKYYCS